MTATVSWEPVKQPESLGLMAPSHFMNLIEEGLGKAIPCVLDEGDKVALHAMAVASQDSHTKKALMLMCNKLSTHDEIRLTVSY